MALIHIFQLITSAASSGRPWPTALGLWNNIRLVTLTQPVNKGCCRMPVIHIQRTPKFGLVWCELRVMDQLLPYTIPCCCAWSTAPTCDGNLFFLKMGTQWGPDFEWNGDLMETLASRNGDPKTVFWWINWNKLIPWNKDENNYSQNVAANSSIHLTFSDKLAWDWYKRVIYHK